MVYLKYQLTNLYCLKSNPSACPNPISWTFLDFGVCTKLPYDSHRSVLGVCGLGPDYIWRTYAKGLAALATESFSMFVSQISILGGIMKIISWNCNMAFRKKSKYIEIYKPDILIVPECESPNKYPLFNHDFKPSHTQWVGGNQSKGLGVYSFSEYSLKVHEMYNPEFKYVLPLKVEGPVNFYLFAVWAMNDRENPFRRYIAQLWLALNYYDSLLSEPTVICGDFNSNVIWDGDKPKRAGTHSDVVNYLKEKGIVSTYHLHYGEEPGQESRSTLYKEEE